LIICKIYGILYKYVRYARANSFDWGKFKLADEFEKRTNKIDVITGKVDTEEGAELRKKKEERAQKQKITAWMRKKAIFYTATVALALIAVVAVAVAVKNIIKNGNSENPETSAVLVIDGENISREEFSFFCSMVIESETFEELSKGNSDVAKLCENVKSAAVKNAEEFICKVHEAEKAGIVLGEKEIADIASSVELAAKKYKNKDEYCTKYYGLSYEDYLNFRKQVLIVSKYIASVSEKADTSEEKQRAVYAKNASDFAKIEAKMIYIDISGLDETELSHKKTNAETWLHYAKDGQDVGQLSEQHSDENSLFDVSEHGSERTVILDKSIPGKYAEIFAAASDMQVGDVELIQTKNEICVIKCVGKDDINDALNSKELIEYVRYAYAAEFFEKAMSGGKYSSVVNNELYGDVDISSYVEAMKTALSEEG